MLITKLEVENFRHIQNQTIEFGRNITVITGQNSTGKSSLLGWIAQAFDFKSKRKTLTGKSFKSKYSEIFRFCKDNDFSKEYHVLLIYKTDEISLEKHKFMKTRYVPKTKNGPERYRVDFDKRGVAIDFPVLYLGLKRLIPLAVEKNIHLKDISLTNEEKKIFSTLSKEILILLDKNIQSEGVTSTNKDLLAMKTEKYSHLGNSAGQDNVGQIISSLISFVRLKNEEKENYKGGIFLIDEIDATLYAGSQIHLIKKLHKFSKKYNIQIIFTTHSLEILEFLTEKINDDIKINFLQLRNGAIKNQINPPITLLRNKIKVQTGQKDKINKIEILCEDKEAELWCKNLVNGTKYKNIINIMQGPFPEGTLSEMAEKKHPIFKKFRFILDGDCRKKTNRPPRTVILPGTTAPEVVFYNFLYNLSDDDSFWIEDDFQNFSKQTCFQHYPNNDLSSTKKWFHDEQIKPFFGKGYSKLFNRWKKSNKNLVKNFQEELENIIKE